MSMFEPASKSFPIYVAVVQTLITSYVLAPESDAYLRYLIAIPVLLYYVLWFRNDQTFSAKHIGLSSLLGYVFLNYLYGFGVQLPGKGDGGSLLPLTFTLAAGYAALTMAVACILISLIRMTKDNDK